MKYLLLYTLLCFAFLNVIAQSDQEKLQSDFRSAKQLFDKGNYRASIDYFRLAGKDIENNPYRPFAYYYLSLANLKVGEVEEAYDFAKFLLQNFSNWEQIDEAYYLMADICWKLDLPFRAYENLQKITDKGFNTSIVDMKRKYIYHIDGVDTLMQLYELNKQDTIIQKALFSKLKTTSLTDEQEKVFYNLRKELFKSGEIKKEVILRKDTYDIAVILPFMVNEIKEKAKFRRNQVILDYFAGMEMARDSLRRLGVTLNINAYDLANDSGNCSALIESGDLLANDVIIGSIYEEMNQMLVKFANANGIPYFIPFVPDQNALDTTHDFYLQRASYQTMAKRAADILLNYYEAKHISIIYGNHKRDTLMARVFIEALDSIADFAYTNKMIDNYNMQKLYTIFYDSIDYDTVTDAAFFVGSNQVLKANYMNAIEKANMHVPVFTTSEWLDEKNFSFEQYERRNFHFLYPDYSYKKPELRKGFKSDYREKMGTDPSSYSMHGFEMIYFLGRQLSLYGLGFNDKLSETGYVDGKILYGFYYTDSLPDNQVVPVIKYHRKKFLTLSKIPGDLAGKTYAIKPTKSKKKKSK